MSDAAQRILIRVDANYDDAPGPRSIDRCAQRTAAMIRSYLSAGTTVFLVGSRGRPVIAPRDSFQRIRANNPTLQFGEFATVIARQLSLPPVRTDRLEALPTVQVPAYRISEQLLLLENAAFDERDASGDQVLARQLAALADRYVIDDLRALSEGSACIVAIPKAIPSTLSEPVQRELALLDQMLAHPRRPFVALVGGSQVARKVGLIRRLGEVVDELLLGGVVANTFLAARGFDLQRTLVDGSQVDAAKQLSGLLQASIALPTDFVWRAGRVMDVGPQTRHRFARSIAAAGTVLIVGPVGVTSPQLDAFRNGTEQVLQALPPKEQALSVAVGDETASVLDALGLTDRCTLVSSGDTTAIEYLATGHLAGLDALRRSRFASQHIGTTTAE